MKSSGSAWTRNATSTFAASTCSRVACQTSLREIVVRRGSTASIRFGLGVDTDPVPDRGQFLFAHEAVRGARAQFALLADQVVGTPVLDRDAGRHEPGGAVLCERGFPAVVPPEPVKQRFRNRKSQPKLLCGAKR